MKLTENKGKEIKESRIWEWVQEELDYRIEVALVELKKCDAEDLSYLQAKISLLEEIKRLPDDVVDREEAYSASD